MMSTQLAIRAIGVIAVLLMVGSALCIGISIHEHHFPIAKARSRSSSVLVAYSDGKDARVVMDLACKTFDDVEGFFMYFVPGITYLERAVEEASARWGVRIHRCRTGPARWPSSMGPIATPHRRMNTSCPICRCGMSMPA